MVWERRYLGGDEGWENPKTKDIIYVVHKTQWEVVLNGKTIHWADSEMEANDVMDKYIDTH